MTHLGATGGHQVSHDTRQPRRVVILARELDSHANREQQAEIREDRTARPPPSRARFNTSGWPRRRRRGATGSTAIGNMSARPILLQARLWKAFIAASGSTRGRARAAAPSVSNARFCAGVDMSSASACESAPLSRRARRKRGTKRSRSPRCPARARRKRRFGRKKLRTAPSSSCGQALQLNSPGVDRLAGELAETQRDSATCRPCSRGT